MKVFLNRAYLHPKYGKIFHWSRLITVTGGAQVIVQAVGLLCGILVIRLLPVNEYAFYTLANTLLGTMSVLADGGISTGVMAEGGKVWQNKEQLGEVLATGLSLRRKFGILSLLISLPILVFLLFHHGASWLSILLIVFSMIPALFAALSDSLLEIIPKLHQDILPLQKNQLLVSIGRLFLSAASLFIFPFTFIAVLANGIPRLYGNLGLYKIIKPYTATAARPNPVVQQRILKIVKRILPGSIYYCLSGQITIWLISIVGTTAAMAQAGALSRLTTVLTLIMVVFSTLVIPRFARLPAYRELLLTRYLQMMAGIIAVGIIICLLAYLYATPFLWLLGPSYANLKTEFFLGVTGGYIALMAGMLFSINTSRGWAIHPLINIPINLLAMAAGIFYLDVSNLHGLFIFNIMIQGVEVIIFAIYSGVKIAGTVSEYATIN